MKQAFQLTRTAQLWQLISVFLVLIPHVENLPIWVPVLVIGCLAWRYLIYIGRVSFLHWSIRSLLVVITGVAIVGSYRAGGGISVTVALLVVGFGLKSLEMYKRRDALLVLYVGYLIAASVFLFSQTFWAALYVFFSVVVITTALLSIYQNRDYPFFYPLRKTVLLIAPAVPLMVVLFLLVPRIGPLWDMGLDRSVARTGLSDTLSAGDISRLTRSAEVAFRVTFDDEPPPQKDLYWRAIVLPDFDGRRWSNRKRETLEPQLRVAKDSPSISYEIIFEPTYKKYVPALDMPVSWPAGVKRNADMTLLSVSEQHLRKQYRFKSSTEFVLSPDNDVLDFHRELFLPNGNDRAKEQALAWWDESKSREHYINKILAFYNRSFVYTLSPPKLGQDSIDQFLFTTQSGFCEHFASTTAFLLRSVGIPARIVTGYQGGEWNPYERYLLVRQYDAHAWVEAWLPDRGWIRIDPTSAVAPERVEKPADEVLQSQSGFLSDTPLLAFGIKGAGWLNNIRLRMEAFNYGWHRWVLNYHHQQQGFLTQLLGELNLWKLALFLSVPFILVIALIMLVQLKRGRVPGGHVCDRAIHELSLHLHQQGLSRGKGETFRQYSLRLADMQPDSVTLLHEAADLYDQIRFQNDDNAQLRLRFSELLKELRYTFLQKRNRL